MDNEEELDLLDDGTVVKTWAPLSPDEAKEFNSASLPEPTTPAPVNADEIAARARQGTKPPGYADYSEHQRPTASSVRPASTGVRPVSNPQKKYIYDLLEIVKQKHPDVYLQARPWIDDRINSFTTKDATKIIDKLKRYAYYLEPSYQSNQTSQPQQATQITPARPAGFDPYDDLPDGRYALHDDAGTLRFYRVSRYKSGGVKLQEQAGPELYPMYPFHARAKPVLEKLRQNPQLCAMTYAQELERCYRCGSELTDPESRANGLGPDCFGMVSW